MIITVCGPVDGSAHDEWEFLIENGCERILVTPAGFTVGARARVWGFKDGGQVEGELIEFRKDTVWMA